MLASSRVVGVATVLAAVFLAGCHPHGQVRPPSAVKRVTLSICSGSPFCNPVEIGSGQLDPLLLENKSAQTIGYRIERKSEPAEAYRIWQGNYSCSLRAVTNLDLTDAEPTTASQNAASALVDSGWAAMVRSTGKPPLRTIRITTGRPRLTELTKQINGDVSASTVDEYAVLVAIEPNPDSSKGCEAYFLAAKPGTTHSLTLYVGTKPPLQTVKLKSGEYLLVDPACTTVPTPKPFPKDADSDQPDCWIVEAVKAANASVTGYSFGAY